MVIDPSSLRQQFTRSRESWGENFRNGRTPRTAPPQNDKHLLQSNK
jgi:hypothetical protein